MRRSRLPLSDVLGIEASDKRLDILRRIGQTGSISAAARAAGVSYKAAWQALETLANLAGTALVDKSVGGSGGGGATLTAAGRRVLHAAQQMAQARKAVLAQIDRGGPADAAPGLAALALRTSMRNQFPCSVGSLESRAGQVRVELRLADGAGLHARITRESVQLLGLRRGSSVLALCKATAVQVARQVDPGPSLNRLEGVVTRASRGRAGGEIGLRLPGGIGIVGFAAPGQGLKVGDAAAAGVEESAVVIAVAD